MLLRGNVMRRDKEAAEREREIRQLLDGFVGGDAIDEVRRIDAGVRGVSDECRVQ